MPPTREFSVKSHLREERMNVLDPSESSFLNNGQNQRFDGQPNIGEAVQQDSSLVFSNNAKTLIERAKLGKPMSDVYNARYLNEVM